MVGSPAAPLLAIGSADGLLGHRFSIKKGRGYLAPTNLIKYLLAVLERPKHAILT